MEERPRSGLEFIVCSVSSALVTVLAMWLIYRAVREPASFQGHEIIGAVCLLALGLYLAYLAWSLHTCRYSLQAKTLTLQQGLAIMEVDLTRSPSLHRWKGRWMWFHSLNSELGLPEVDFYPPISFFREHSTWVLAYIDEEGEERGVAFRPSPRLLHQIRDIYMERHPAIGQQ